MTGEQIKKMLDDRKQNKIFRQMELYRNYYMTRNPALLNRIKERDYQRKTPNWCVPTAYFETVIDTHAGYLFSNVKYNSADGAYEDELKKVLDDNDVEVKDMKAGLNALTYNRAYELVYTLGDGKNLKGTQIKFSPLDPLSVIPIYSDDIEPKLLAIVWDRKSNDRRLVDYISATIWQQYEEKEEKKFELLDEKELPFSTCPVVEYRAEMIGDVSPFDSVISYIEALDWAITGNSNEIDRIVDAILLLGKKMDKDINLTDIKAIDDISKDEITPQFLEKNLSPEFRKYVTELLIQEIYRHSHTVDWHTTLTGDTSAKALKIRLFDMDMYSKRIEKVFREGANRRIAIISEILKIRDNLAPEVVEITYNRTLPNDNDTMIQVLSGCDFISNQTKQEWVGLDSTIEEQRLAEEYGDKAELPDLAETTEEE